MNMKLAQRVGRGRCKGHNYKLITINYSLYPKTFNLLDPFGVQLTEHCLVGMQLTKIPYWATTSPTYLCCNWKDEMRREEKYMIMIIHDSSQL